MSESASQHERDLMSCVHCGFCLNSCPTYLETGSEADSPRGRITLMRAMHEENVSVDSPDLRRHLDLCLGCRACEPACPSGVPYGNLIEAARKQMNEVRPAVQRFARKSLLDTLSYPKAMKLSLGASKFTDRNMPSQLSKLIQSDPEETAANFYLPKPRPTLPLPSIIPAIGTRRARVGMLTGCVMSVVYGDVHQDTAAILSANGIEVLINQRQACCGALHLHNGFVEEGKGLAKRLVDAFGSVDGLDAIIVNSAGCGSTLKEYGELLADDPAYSDRARNLASKCVDITEFLDDICWIAPLKSLPITVTYHDACHLAQAQRITEQPRHLLGMIPQINLVPLQESEVCCGSAGIYNLTEPEMATKLQRRKIDHILRTGASVVVTGNPGCMAWIEAGLRDKRVEVVHPASIMRRALCSDPMLAS